MSLAARSFALVPAAAGVAMVMAGLWCWQTAVVHAQTADRPDLAGWAVRFAGVALLATGQVVIAWAVLPMLYRRGRGDRLFGSFCLLAAFAAVLAAGVLAVRAW
jgi:hypothetical protein